MSWWATKRISCAISLPVFFAHWQIYTTVPKLLPLPLYSCFFSYSCVCVQLILTTIWNLLIYIRWWHKRNPKWKFCVVPHYSPSFSGFVQLSHYFSACLSSVRSKRKQVLFLMMCFCRSPSNNFGFDAVQIFGQLFYQSLNVQLYCFFPQTRQQQKQQQRTWEEPKSKADIWVDKWIAFRWSVETQTTPMRMFFLNRANLWDKKVFVRKEKAKLVLAITEIRWLRKPTQILLYGSKFRVSLCVCMCVGQDENKVRTLVHDGRISPRFQWIVWETQPHTPTLHNNHQKRVCYTSHIYIYL